MITTLLWILYSRIFHQPFCQRCYGGRAISAILGVGCPYKSVMLVAMCRDVNDVVLPIVFWEVQKENLDSWAFFHKNLYEGLRMDYMDYGKGICIMCDGEKLTRRCQSSFPTLNIGSVISVFTTNLLSNFPMHLCNPYFGLLVGTQTRRPSNRKWRYCKITTKIVIIGWLIKNAIVGRFTAYLNRLRAPT